MHMLHGVVRNLNIHQYNFKARGSSKNLVTDIYLYFSPHIAEHFTD